LTERELIEGCLRGKKHCEKALFDRFAGKMMAICMRYAPDPADAEDILQESFIRVFEHLPSFRHEGSLEGWIRRIVVTSALKHLRRAKPTQELTVQEDFKESSDVPDAITQLGEQEILRLIGELPHGYRMVFNLFVIEGYRHHEIAELLAIEESTSRSQLVKARKWLQEKLLGLTRLSVL
jgi:RNA polymerase sigma factor (sigma-70 family)